jgi:hypothetical protein
MLDKLKKELALKFGDKKLIENLFYSFQKISEEYIAQKPVDLLQNVGLFVESVLRISEHIIFGSHTPLSDKFNIDNAISKLEKASGAEGVRIHVARLSRAIYDFRTRKKSVHLKFIDPQLIDAGLIFNIANWIMIEILKESSISNPEKIISLFYSRKIPLVQEIDGIFRTTNPTLSGPQRILLLLYSSPNGLNEEELFEGTKIKIKDIHHLKINLKNLYKKDLIHYKKDKCWILFGKGFLEAEDIIKKFCL